MRGPLEPAAVPAAQETDAAWRRRHAPGLVTGILAFATAWFALSVVVRLPLGVLALNLALAWGTYTVVELGIRRHPASHTAWVPALAPWLAAPMLLRMHLLATEETMPAWLVATWTLEALSVALGVIAVLVYRHLLDDLASAKASLVCSGAIALALSGVFLLLHLTMPRPVDSGALGIFAMTLVIVSVSVAAQHLLLRRNRRPRWRAVAGGAALAVTASQLLDGFVTYLAVIDPFHLLDKPMTEQVALSAWLLDVTGIGYPIAKWMLALAIAYLLERGWTTTDEPTPKRTGIYLALIFVGLGPALYSTASLLS